MDIEGVLAILLIFGGGTMIGLAMSPIGRAIAARIQGGTKGAMAVHDHQAILEEVEGLRRDIGELQERVDFTERMLSRQREERLPGQGSGPFPAETRGPAHA